MAGLVLLLGRGCAWLFVLSAALSAYEVAMRYLFGAPSSWVQETVTALCAIGFAFGGAWTALSGSHIRISLVPDRLGPGARRGLAGLAAAIGLFYLAGLLWGVWLQAVEAIWRFDGDVWTPELVPGPPGWALPSLVKGALVLATALFIAVEIALLLRPSSRRDA